MVRLPTAKFTRRKFLTTSVAVGAGVYIYQRGLRYPRLSFEHHPVASRVDLPAVTFELDHTIALLPTAATDIVSLRAFAPQPGVRLRAHTATNLTFEIGNIAGNAVLEADGAPASTINESIDGLNRILQVKLQAGDSAELRWILPEQNGIRFAAIGDSGAGLELEWLLPRAAQLGAQFLLHLGDFNYSPGEYDRAIELFRTAPIPCYVSIGNHDFNESGLIYQKFLDQIGPLNHSFSFAGARFVNIDTAVDFFPANSGHRGALFASLEQDPTRYFDQVCFTHRPFVDPRAGRDHVIGGLGEISWLQRQIKKSGGNTLLTGHVHRSAELDVDGIHQFTAGEGLGFEDIVAQKRVAQLLIGEVEFGQAVRYQWQPIDMPWSAHRSPTHEFKLKLEQPPEKLEWYRQMLERTRGELDQSAAFESRPMLNRHHKKT